MKDDRVLFRFGRACGGGSVVLLLWACGGANGASAPASGDPAATNLGAAPPGRFEREVCPECVAGGETTDFGGGAAFLPGGSGVRSEPTPCELSTTTSSIELEAARGLGFGRVLDQLEQSFDLSLEWRPTEDDLDRPASGYQERSRLRGTTALLSAQHLVPSLAGCGDSLLVTVSTTLETEDGALSIAGNLTSLVERTTRVPRIEGLLDLSLARGSLQIEPPPSSEPIVGYVLALMHAWPGEMRMSLGVGAIDLPGLAGDTYEYLYRPLEGRAPVDACQPNARPLAFDEPTPSVAEGQSLADRYGEILSLVSTPQPLSARWDDGGETQVTADVGQPLSICDANERLLAQVPYHLQSADGRVDIEGEALASLPFVDGAIGAGWFSISRSDDFQTPEAFAAISGISGVDLDEYGGAAWYTELDFDPAGSPVLTGTVTVHGHDVDGHVTGVPNAIVRRIASLRW